MVYTGNLAEQLINGVIKIVRSRSFLFSIFLALMIAGTAAGKTTDHRHYAFAV